MKNLNVRMQENNIALGIKKERFKKKVA